MKKLSLVVASILIPSFGRCYDNYTMEKDIVLTMPLSQDVYSVGSNLQPQESIKGDLLIAGGNITISQPVAKDAMIAGGNIKVENTIGESLRVVGGSIKITSSIGQDLIAAGGAIDIESGTQVKGMTMIAGKNINLQGTFQDTEIVGSTIYLNASFQNLKIQAEEIVLGPQAKILGNLNYSSKQKIPALEALVVGTKTFEALDTHMSETKNRISNNFWSIIVGFLGYKFFFLVIFGSILYFSLPKYFQKFGEIIQEKPRVMGLRGLVLVAVTPIVIFLLALTGIGLPLAGLLGGGYFFLFLLYELACVVVFTGLVAHVWLYKKDLPNKIYLILTLIVLSLFFTLINGIDIIPALFVFGASITMKAKILKNYLK